MSTLQHKFNHVNPFSCSWDISRQSFYSYWWPDISVICCHFCAFHTYTDSPHLRLFQCNLVCENWSTSCGDTSWMKFVTELNNHMIYPEWCLISNYTSLTISIPIIEEYVNSSKWSIIKNSDEEAAFIKDITNSFKELNTSNLSIDLKLLSTLLLIQLNVHEKETLSPLISQSIQRASGMRTVIRV